LVGAAYARDWLNNASLFHLLLYVTESKVGAELLAGLILLALWHFTWSIPFLCFHPSAAWLIMGVTCVLGYTLAISYGAGEPLKNSLLILSLEYVPVYLWLAYSFGPRAEKSYLLFSQEAGALASNL
jgi:hypothetical protein